jgi:ATP-binding cassette subfamily F protein 3
MREKLTRKLADPALYEANREGERQLWQDKFGEVEEALERAEAMWMAALETLEDSGG